MLVNLETLETKPKSPHLFLNSQLRTHKDYLLCTTVAGLVISHQSPDRIWEHEILQS
jgi:hypothetical protein